jgi:hypothetical protein
MSLDRKLLGSEKKQGFGNDKPRLWSSGQSSRLRIQRSRFYSWRYQIFWEVVGLEGGPLSLMSTFESCLKEKVMAAF